MKPGVLVCVVVVAFLGCRKEAGNAPGPSAVSDVDLKLIGMAYHSHAALNPGRAPTQLAELQPYLAQHADEKRAYEHLKNGTVVFLFGVPLKELEAAGRAGATVIAYDRLTPKQGGWAALADGSVRRFTKEEFGAASLAKAKP